MVTGMEVFRLHFAGYEDAFVVIGGAACDEWFARMGGRFRATKDIDLVLVLDAVLPRFAGRFWEFIQLGRYAVAQRSDGKRAFYRFQKPQTADYPKMIELLSTTPVGMEPPPGRQVTPIPVGEDISSLSAILMDPEYHGYVMATRDVVAGLPLLRPEGLIALKAKAWLDLSSRRAAGDTTVKEDDVNKHRSDVFRLSSILPAGTRFEVPGSIRADLHRFAASFPPASPAWPAIVAAVRSSGIRLDKAGLLGALTSAFRLEEDAT